LLRRSYLSRLTQTKQVLPLSNEHGSQVKNQDWRQCCHNKHKNFPICLHLMYLYFPDTPRRFVSPYVKKLEFSNRFMCQGWPIILLVDRVTNLDKLMTDTTSPMYKHMCSFHKTCHKSYV
jgi:hypothetical protein